MNVALIGQFVACCRNQFPQLLAQQQRHLNANRAALTKIKRARFQRLYPTTLVQPDGSTIEIKYPEPRIALRLPVDLETASPELHRKILLRRSPRQKLQITEETEDSFDPNKYLKL